MTATKVAAVYLRVSTDRQTTGNQIEDLQRLVQARGYEPAIFEEVESGAKARPVFDAAADLVAAGVPVAEAARQKGVSRASLRRWMAERASPRAQQNGPEDGAA